MIKKFINFSLVITTITAIVLAVSCNFKAKNTEVIGYFLESEKGLPLSEAKIYLMEDFSQEGNGIGSIIESTQTNEEGYFQIKFPAESGKLYRIDFSGELNGVSFSGSREVIAMQKNIIHWYLNQEVPRLQGQTQSTQEAVIPSDDFIEKVKDFFAETYDMISKS